MAFSIQSLAERLNARVLGPIDSELRDVAPLETASPEHLSYSDSKKNLAVLKKSRAGAFLINEELVSELADDPRPRLIVDDPQGAFIAAMLLFRPQPSRSSIGVSAQAIVSPSARLGADCNVHPGAMIGERVTIGDRCEIGPGVVIGDDCQIGDDCVLNAYVVFYPKVRIQNRVMIHAHAVLGADGFGYRFRNGALVKIPHTGTVLIEDDVEIGAGSTIDRAMIEATVIGQGTKLDNQVMIAHNCQIGRANAFASQVGLAGSVRTGAYVQMGGQVGIADHVTIGDGVRLGGKAGVMDNLTEPGIYHGVPAEPEKDAIKKHLIARKVPEIREQVKRLTAQVAALQEQLAELNAVPSQRSAA